MSCAHCFVSATKHGKDMPLPEVVKKVVPRLVDGRVRRVTLTGGEPTIHPDFLGIVHAFRNAGFRTNATELDDNLIRQLATAEVHVNVTLDGFAADSHGLFRGDRASIDVTVTNVRKLAAASLLQGLLCTPNSLAADDKYVRLCVRPRERRPLRPD